MFFSLLIGDLVWQARRIEIVGIQLEKKGLTDVAPFLFTRGRRRGQRRIMPAR
jgi:hypothetical protein